MPPAQVEALGRLTADDFVAIAARAPARSGAEDGRAGSESPLLIGGESHFQQILAKESGALSSRSDSLIFDGKDAKILPAVRRIPGQLVGLDYVSCVWRPDEKSVEAWFRTRQGIHSDFVALLGYEERLQATARYVIFIMLDVLGLPAGSTKQFPNGLNMYRFAEKLPLDAGIVHVGHRSGTCLVTISGQGALVASPGWEQRLYDFLSSVEGWLTRVDLAFDDFEGEYFPVRKVREKAQEGAFQRGGRPPHFELRGNWENDDPEGGGLTFYVGSRTSGKFARLYEKGRQLGDKSSLWVRFEIEYRSSGFVLPLEILLRPTQFFVAAYPICEVIENTPERVDLEYRARSIATTYEKVIANIRHQYGVHLAALRNIHSDSELLDLVCREGSVDWYDTFIRVTDVLMAPAADPSAEPGILGK